MKLSIKNGFCLMFLSILFFKVSTVSAAKIDAPTMLKINSYTNYALAAPVISGITEKGSDVLVYIDDKPAGKAVIQKTTTQAAGFYFQAFNLKEGKHQAYLIAEKGGARSEKSKTFNVEVKSLSAPIIVVPNGKTITSSVKPRVEGNVLSGTFVRLYVDGVYNGKTGFVEDRSGVAHFSYFPYLNLSVGRHRIWAVAEDKNGRRSPVSGISEFRVEEKMPAPTLLRTIGNSIDSMSIAGLAKNDSRIKVFVDKKEVKSFDVTNHKSGVANFSFSLNNGLLNAGHLVYVTATDGRGKESGWSNFLSVGLRRQRMVAASAVKQRNGRAAISAEAASETNTVKASEKSSGSEQARSKINEYLKLAEAYNKDKSKRLEDRQYEELKTLIKDNYEKAWFVSGDKKMLEALLASKDSGLKTEEKESAEQGEAATNTKSGGALDESKKSQSIIGWNAIIFVLFLMAVIAWIFWVNRELIKEKKEQEEKTKSEK